MSFNPAIPLSHLPFTFVEWVFSLKSKCRFLFGGCFCLFPFFSFFFLRAYYLNRKNLRKSAKRLIPYSLFSPYLLYSVGINLCKYISIWSKSLTLNSCRDKGGGRGVVMIIIVIIYILEIRLILILILILIWYLSLFVLY